jgi:hypothetical protein
MSLSKISMSAITISGLMVFSDAATERCVKFSEKHKTPESIPKDLWYGAFTYEEDEEKAYDVWFDDPKNNPNDALTKQFVDNDIFTVPDSSHFDGEKIDKCYLDYEHKGEDDELDNFINPNHDPMDFKLCKPWSNRGCCGSDILDKAKFLEKFEDWYNLGSDKCGKLKPECEEFFVQEECFYLCDPNVGLFRAYTSDDSPDVGNNASVFDPNNDDHKWPIKGMPIKASYWNNMWDACKDEMFMVKEDPVSGGSVLAPLTGVTAGFLVLLV